MVPDETFWSRMARVALTGTALVMMFLIIAFTVTPSRGIYGFQFQVIRDGRSVKIIIRHGPEQPQWAALLLGTGSWVVRHTARGISVLAACSVKVQALVHQAYNRRLGKGTRLVVGSVQSVTYRLRHIGRRRS